MPQVKKHACEICGKMFGFRCSVTAHIKKVHEKLYQKPKLKFKCEKCGKKFRSQDTLDDHVQKEHENPNAIFKCVFCSTSFDEPRALKKHANKEHQTILFVCNKCGKCFIEETGLEAHLEFVHGIKENEPPDETENDVNENEDDNVNENENENYNQNEIDPSTLVESKFQDDTIDNEPFEENDYEYANDEEYDEDGYVDYDMNVQDNYEDERKFNDVNVEDLKPKVDLLPFDTTHHEIKYDSDVFHEVIAKMKPDPDAIIDVSTPKITTPSPKKSPKKATSKPETPSKEKDCQICGKSFSTPKDLRRHMSTHEKTKQSHTCDQCGKTFSRADNLKSHIRIFHEKTEKKRPSSSFPKNGVIPFCELCNKTFSAERKLKAHIRNIHQGIKDHVCDECGKAFYQKNHLDDHIKYKHTEENRVICDVCGNNFATPKSLKRHKELNHERSDMSFEYETCQEVFTIMKDLNNHIGEKCSEVLLMLANNIFQAFINILAINVTNYLNVTFVRKIS